jgi:hypothetical protein
MQSHVQTPLALKLEERERRAVAPRRVEHKLALEDARALMEAGREGARERARPADDGG